MIDLIFGKLTVAAEAGRDKHNKKLWLCKCACGASKVAEQTLLRAGKVKSCGCLRVEMGRAHGAKLNLRHGEGGNGKETTEYKTWAAMLSRCNNKNHHLYDHYGARGIEVCFRWHTYENFLADMGRRPSDSHSIDRIDNDGPYELANCRWATGVEQSANQRPRRANPPARAISTVKQERGRPARVVAVHGVTKTLPEWLVLLGLKRSQLYGRARTGSVEQVLAEAFDALIG